MLSNVSTESKGFTRELIPVGPHHAVIAHMIDWGTQTEVYEGQERQRRTLRVGFIFPDILQEFEVDGEKVTKPAMISKWYTLSLDPKSNLHRDVMNILGRSLGESEDLTKLLGHQFMASVVHKEKKNGEKFDTIGSFMPLMAGTEPKAVAPESLKLFDLDNPDKGIFDSLGEKEQEKIKATKEYTPF